jgi:hypothetical protein
MKLIDFNEAVKDLPENFKEAVSLHIEFLKYKVSKEKHNEVKAKNPKDKVIKVKKNKA